MPQTYPITLRLFNETGEIREGKLLEEDYFTTGVWRADGPLAFRHCTCAVCGERLSTWESFKAHRDVCRQREIAISPSRGAADLTSLPVP